MNVYALTIDLGAPIAASDPYIHLDAFVSYAAGVEAVGYDGLDKLSDGGDPVYFTEEMPFKRYAIGDEWVWAASSASIAEPENEPDEPERWNTTAWRKRFDHEPDHQIKKTNVNQSSGSFKSYNAELPYTGADKLVFFFEPKQDTEPERVVDLIDQHVPAIGKKRSQGFGRIQSVELAGEMQGFDTALCHNGRCLRSLPTTFTERVVSGVSIDVNRTVRPPYWHPENQSTAYPPFAEIPKHLLVVGDE